MMHGPGDDSELDEVKVTTQKVPLTSVSSAPKTDPREAENLPEIVVQGTRIPWWVWAVAGSALALVLIEVTKGNHR